MSHLVDPAEDQRPSATARIKVWDLVVRLFHWTVVAGCILNLWLLPQGKALHKYTGYVIGGAVLVRVVWGFVGSRYARFSSFLPRPDGMIAHAKALAAGSRKPTIGHTPLGGLMIIALLLNLAALVTTGWMIGLDAFWGAKWLRQTHALLANSLLLLAALHLCGVLVESFLTRQNLVGSMITGLKKVPHDSAVRRK